jgi:hypothetical protein
MVELVDLSGMCVLMLAMQRLAFCAFICMHVDVVPPNTVGSTDITISPSPVSVASSHEAKDHYLRLILDHASLVHARRSLECFAAMYGWYHKGFMRSIGWHNPRGNQHQDGDRTHLHFLEWQSALWLESTSDNLVSLPCTSGVENKHSFKDSQICQP